MYNIDLSFIQSDTINDTELKETEDKCNERFQNIIINHGNGEVTAEENCGCKNQNPDNGKIDSRTIIEAECEGFLGLHYCEIPSSLKQKICKGDKIIVKSADCFDISTVIETGEMVKFKRQKCGCANEEIPTVDRIASEKDLASYSKNCEDENKAKPIFAKLVEKYELNMKLINIHYQFDRKKLYFFYTSDGRVDFRQLAKDLAGQFRTRIELRQMGVRDEAKQMGGLGTCGREYCCASFISNFKRISTQHACEQNLSSNLSKLSGPCSKLKCCLSFEADN